MWQELFNVNLTTQWQLSEITKATNFRLSHTFNQNGSSYQPMALIALARVNEDNKLEIFNSQKIIPREESEIIQFSLLPFQWQYSIATKLLVAPSRLSSKWSLQIDMPLYSTIAKPNLSQVCDTYNGSSATLTSELFTKILDANYTRRKFRIVNASNQPVYIGVNPTFPIGEALVMIPAQSAYVDDIGWCEAIYANKFNSETDDVTLDVWEYGLVGEYVPPTIEAT